MTVLTMLVSIILLSMPNIMLVTVLLQSINDSEAVVGVCMTILHFSICKAGTIGSACLDLANREMSAAYFGGRSLN